MSLIHEIKKMKKKKHPQIFTQETSVPKPNPTIYWLSMLPCKFSCQFGLRGPKMKVFKNEKKTPSDIHPRKQV